MVAWVGLMAFPPCSKIAVALEGNLRTKANHNLNKAPGLLEILCSLFRVNFFNTQVNEVASRLDRRDT